MRITKLAQSILIAVLAAPVFAGESEILPWDALDGEKRIRETVERRFPELEFGFYHWSGEWIVGALEDFDQHRILLLLPCDDRGNASFTRNGQVLDLPPGKPATLKLAGALATPDGTESSPEHAGQQKIGYWITLEATDRFEMTVDLTWPCKGKFSATYDPDNGWQTSCTFEVADQNRRKPADAYEVTRRSLLKRVLEVLRTQEVCVVRLQSLQCYRVNFTLRKWPPRDVGLIDPLELTLTDRIVLGVGEGRVERTPRELARDLEMYSDAAMAANVKPLVRIRLREDTDDKVFRTTLNALAVEGIRFPYVLLLPDKPETTTTKPNKSE